MSSSATVHWEWFYRWNHAVKTYFPKFDTNKIVKAFYAVSVPFNFPMLPCLTWFCTYKNKFTVIGESTILFHPREWRGTDHSRAEPFASRDYLTPKEMAAEINGYKRGSVGHLYLTSDGGFTIQNLYDMVDMLDDHVEVVNFATLSQMAIDANKAGLADQIHL